MLLDPSPRSDFGNAAAGADAADVAASVRLPAAIDAPATIADRVRRGVAAGRVEGDAIVPFTDAWGLDELIVALKGPVAAEIVAKLNADWKPTFHTYRDEEGRGILVVFRMDHPTGAERKFVRPLRVQRMIGIRADVVLGTLPSPRPLYALDQIASRPEAPVLFVEGEKAADSGAALFPDHVVTTWPGGADGISGADLRCMKGRGAVVWPDHDSAGAKAGRNLGRALLLAGIETVRIVRVPSTFPPKWDIADPVPRAARG